MCTALGLDEKLVWRQPFPGPGLAIRIIGDITPEKVATLQNADAIFREEIAAAGLDRDINQYFAVLTNMRSVGVMGDGRTYDYTLALRGVSTSDFMTADFIARPGPGNGCLHTSFSSKPSAVPRARTSSLNSRRSGSIISLKST